MEWLFRFFVSKPFFHKSCRDHVFLFVSKRLFFCFGYSSLRRRSNGWQVTYGSLAAAYEAANQWSEGLELLDFLAARRKNVGHRHWDGHSSKNSQTTCDWIVSPEVGDDLSKIGRHRSSSMMLPAAWFIGNATISATRSTLVQPFHLSFNVKPPLRFAIIWHGLTPGMLSSSVLQLMVLEWMLPLQKGHISHDLFLRPSDVNIAVLLKTNSASASCKSPPRHLPTFWIWWFTIRWSAAQQNMATVQFGKNSRTSNGGNSEITNCGLRFLRSKLVLDNGRQAREFFDRSWPKLGNEILRWPYRFWIVWSKNSFHLPRIFLVRSIFCLKRSSESMIFVAERSRSR